MGRHAGGSRSGGSKVAEVQEAAEVPEVVDLQQEVAEHHFTVVIIDLIMTEGDVITVIIQPTEILERVSVRL